MSKTIIYGPRRLQNSQKSPSPLSAYHICRRLARWLRQIRHRCGYGVQSPLAFDFITGVIYNKEPYYAYDDLRQGLTPSLARLDVYDPESGLIDKDLRLLFRIANYQEARRIALLGASPAVERYIRAACPSATLVDDPATADFVYCDDDTLPSPQNSPITFDLGRLFIVLERPKMIPQHYVVNYF